METYKFSKLRRLLALVRFTMEDTMRFLVEASLSKYVGYIRTACATKVRALQKQHCGLFTAKRITVVGSCLGRRRVWVLEVSGT